MTAAATIIATLDEVRRHVRTHGAPVPLDAVRARWEAALDAAVDLCHTADNLRLALDVGAQDVRLAGRGSEEGTDAS